jgi:glycosyltransferase involved in cell wall biosynthesis
MPPTTTSASPVTAAQQLAVLHVVVQLGPTNSQYHEHCLPALGRRRLVVCSLLRATTPTVSGIELVQGGSRRTRAAGALFRALRHGPFDAVHAHAPMSGLLVIGACLLRQVPRRRLVYTVHGSYHHYSPRNRLLTCGCLAFFPHVVLCGEAVRETLPRPLRRRPVVVTNGVDCALLGDVPTRRRGTETRTDVAVVGRLTEGKNVATLVRAVAASPADIRLTVVGDGPARSELERLALDLGCADRVRFTGLLSRADVHALLPDVDALASASWSEGLPVGVLEGMAAGLPVVLSDIPSHREVLGAGGGARLVRPDDVQGFRDAIAALDAAGADERARLGRLNRARVEEQFSTTAMLNSYERVYERAAGKVGTA